MAKTVAPYGSWRSPISIEQCAATGDPWFAYAVVDLAADGLTWIEPRADEEGRAVLVHRRADGSRAELTPRGFDARTRVHEYGGGAAWRHGDTFFFSHFGDGRVYRVDGLEGEPRPVTPEPAEPNALRYADGRVTAGRVDRLLRARAARRRRRERARRVSGGRLGRAACRRHRPRLLRGAAHRPGRPSRVPGVGRPAASVPRDRALGRRRADRGRRRASRSSSRSGGPTARSTGSPTATAGGTSTATASSSPCSGPSSAYPQWVFDLSAYGFLADGRIACTVIEKAVHSFAVLDPATRELDRLDLPFTASMPHLRADGDRFAVVAATPLEAPAIVLVDVTTGDYETVVRTDELALDPDSISVGRPIEFASANGRTRARLLLRAGERRLRGAARGAAAARSRHPRRPDLAGLSRLQRPDPVPDDARVGRRRRELRRLHRLRPRVPRPAPRRMGRRGRRGLRRRGGLSRGRRRGRSEAPVDLGRQRRWVHRAPGARDEPRLRGGDLRLRRHRPRPLRRDHAQVRGALPATGCSGRFRKRSRSTATARRSSTPTRSARPC